MRKNTERLLEMLDEGMLDRDQVILACVKFMPEEQVKAMCNANDFFPMADEDEE